jgi:hypothetical protein
MTIFKKLIISVFGGFLLIAFVLGASAQSSISQKGIQISPLTYNFEINPGESQTAKLYVTNRNDEDLNYIVEVELFDKVTEEGVPSFKVSEKKEGVSTLVDWISFLTEKEGVVKAGKEKEIQFKIDVPKNAEPGGHYGAVFVRETRKTPSGEGAQLGVASRVGALILVSVPGTVTKGGKIIEFDAPKFAWKGPIDFVMRVQNTGTVHYDSKAEVEIKPILGKVSKVGLGTHTIIPKFIRIFKGSWDKKYPFGYYELTGKATDGDGKIMTASATMWAIPLVIVLPVVFALIIFILVIRYIRRHYRIVSK